MRVGVILIAISLLAASPADGATAPYWSVGKVLRRLDGAKLQVGSRKVRVDSETTLCAGYGTSIRRGRERLWLHFTCTYTTFTKALVDKDLEFRLHVRSATRFSISDAHWIGGATES